MLTPDIKFLMRDETNSVKQTVFLVCFYAHLTNNNNKDIVETSIASELLQLSSIIGYFWDVPKSDPIKSGNASRIRPVWWIISIAVNFSWYMSWLRHIAHCQHRTGIFEFESRDSKHNLFWFVVLRKKMYFEGPFIGNGNFNFCNRSLNKSIINWL